MREKREEERKNNDARCRADLAPTEFVRLLSAVHCRSGLPLLLLHKTCPEQLKLLSLRISSALNADPRTEQSTFLTLQTHKQEERKQAQLNQKEKTCAGATPNSGAGAALEQKRMKKQLLLKEMTLEKGRHDISLQEAEGLPKGVYVWKVFTRSAKTQGHLIKI